MSVGSRAAAAKEEETQLEQLRGLTGARPQQRELECGRARGAFPGWWGRAGPAASSAARSRRASA